jgi:hypothetical protein
VVQIAGSLTGLSGPFALAFDSHGRLLVGDEGKGVIVFAKNANGNVAPQAIVTGFREVAGVTSNAQDDIWVGDFGGNAIEEFAPNASGPSTPLRAIKGSKTTLNAPAYVAIR